MGVGSALVALIVAAAVYAVGMGIFGIEVHSWPGFLLVVLAVCCFVGGFALLLAGLGRSEAQISSIGTFAVLIMSFAGGAMFPSFMMPDWLQKLSLGLPTYWATRGLAAATWRALPIGEILPSVGMLLVFAVGCGVVGIRRFCW
jgi:ABC-2 type transport system permease protein